MKTNNNLQKPWLDQRGRPLPAEQLLDISKNWDVRTWNRYLQSIDGSIEGVQLVSGRKLRTKCDYLTQSIFDQRAEKNEPDSVQNKIRSTLAILSERQRQVIDSIYFEGLSIEKTAAKLNLSKPTVFEYKKSALAKLKGANAVSPNDLTNMRGEEELKIHAPYGIDPEVYEVFLSECNRLGASRRGLKRGGL